MEVKMGTIWLGLLLGKRLSADNVILESDCQAAILILRGPPSNTPWVLRAFPLECKKLIESIPSLRMSFIPRFVNIKAHEAAKITLD